MIQYEHKDYEWYKAVQRKLTAKKTRYGNRYYTWIDEKEMTEVNRLIHLYTKDIQTVVCHGCRCGLEVDVLQKLNPIARVFGTDIYGDAYKYDRTYFREMDFDEVPPEWVEYFDVVYSNSIDHSREPIRTLLAWKSELKDGGICFVNFHWGRGVSREDCFHLDSSKWESEIREITRKVGMKILYISDPIEFADGASCADVIYGKNNCGIPLV